MNTDVAVVEEVAVKNGGCHDACLIQLCPASLEKAHCTDCLQKVVWDTCGKALLLLKHPDYGRESRG